MDFVDNVVNAKTGTIRGRAIFENKDGLLTPGFFGRMRLYGGQRDAFLIPDSVISSDQASKIVFTVADDGTVGTVAKSASALSASPSFASARSRANHIVEPFAFAYGSETIAFQSPAATSAGTSKSGSSARCATATVSAACPVWIIA